MQRLSRWFPRSLVTRITLGVLLLFSLAAGTVYFTIAELELRKHDYVILNLTGELRAIARNLSNQGLLLRDGLSAESVTISGQRAVLLGQMARYRRIISSLKNRVLDPELTGRDDPLSCSWDQQSIASLDNAARHWESYEHGLMPLLADGGRIAEAADYIQLHEAELNEIASGLAKVFQRMMEGKLSLLTRVNQAMLLVTLLTLLLLMGLLYVSFIRPLRMTLRGLERVAQGDFTQRVPVRRADELGRVAETFNVLTERIDAIFRLTQRIDQARTLDETLRFVFEEFRQLLPLDWLGLLTLSEDGSRFSLNHRFAEGGTGLVENSHFKAEGSLLLEALESGQPLHIAELSELAARNASAEFARVLADDGRRSALFFPVNGNGKWGAVLAFAVREPAAYDADHLDLLGNIGAQVGQGFAKTVLTENLVISAITGLAKLAENRDPETGDHLVRMAHYSAILAEELGREGKYAGQITPEHVRDILRFAPMHDIGKVGIEDSILLKPGRLSDAERQVMQNHPTIGGEVLRSCEAQMNAVGHSVFQVGIEIAEGHHERFDGNGYPNGLQGEAIPLSARVVACADVFDALTSKRPYKEAWPVERALETIRGDAGQHFDPEVVSALERAMPKVLAIYERLKHV